MKDIKKLEMGIPDYQKSRRRFPRKSSRETPPIDKIPETIKVPTILRKENAVINSVNETSVKENGVDVSNSSTPSHWDAVQNTHVRTDSRNDHKHRHHGRHYQPEAQHHSDPLYNQNYPQLLKKALGELEGADAPRESPKKEPYARTPPVPPLAPPPSSMARAVEKAREYSLSWVSPVMKTPAKLIENFNWASNIPNVLKDQSNYVVVGVLGAQSTGKSSLLSHLAGFPAVLGNRMLFEPPPLDHPTSHSTQGVDLFVSQERMILLDSQAMFSMSSTAVLKKKKRFVGDKQFCDDSVDAQSLQLASFLLSVCNVVIVLLDYFLDEQIVKLLSTAEMLKPKASSNLADVQDPHVVFVLNRATESDWLMVKQMSTLFHPLLSQQSLLRFTGMFSMTEEGEEEDKKQDHNIILLPPFEDAHNRNQLENNSYNNNNNNNNNNANNNNNNTNQSILGCVSVDHPTYQQQVRHLRNTILSLPKDQMFNKLSEKIWLQYASKAWDLVRKSSFISDYSRLLS